ncbi:uncharacterized protein LOC143233542 [Tachypleus tridentatus]|uniref:uncharacterized protein LOC143233542 n=3 Tax=Tachypleus tridentatus TaxID=6853 RepID=UPI003FD4B31B
MKMYLWHFDTRFKYLTELPLEGRSFLGELPLPEPDTEPIAKRRCAKKPLEDSRNKTLLEMLQAPPDVKSLYSPTTCSCRISCRTGRCSCAKMIRKCSMLSCMCGDCDNPLNVLESMEIDLEKVISDPCLLYNVYKVTNLRRYLLGTVVLPCCGYIATLLDVVPGLRDCPNGNCRKKLQFSWCRGYVCEESVNPRNHCNTCMKCCVMDEKHCMHCNKCYIKGMDSDQCPNCDVSSSTDFDLSSSSDVLQTPEDENRTEVSRRDTAVSDELSTSISYSASEVSVKVPLTSSSSRSLFALPSSTSKYHHLFRRHHKDPRSSLCQLPLDQLHRWLTRDQYWLLCHQILKYPRLFRQRLPKITVNPFFVY